MVKIRIVKVRINGAEYNNTVARLYAETQLAFSNNGDYIPVHTYSRAVVQTVNADLIAYLHDQQTKMQRIDVEIESDGIIETARQILLNAYTSSRIDGDALRSFEGTHGLPIKTRKAEVG